MHFIHCYYLSTFPYYYYYYYYYYFFTDCRPCSYDEMIRLYCTSDFGKFLSVQLWNMQSFLVACFVGSVAHTWVWTRRRHRQRYCYTSEARASKLMSVASLAFRSLLLRRDARAVTCGAFEGVLRASTYLAVKTSSVPRWHVSCRLLTGCAACWLLKWDLTFYTTQYI